MAELFGTDGIRGVANVHPMTIEIAMKIGRAVAYKFSRGRAKEEKRKAKIVIGKDTRLSGYMIEQALAAGICSMGADVLLVGPLPTPGIAYITQSMRADAGIVISASHNKFSDNGIKIFDHNGFKLSDPIEEEIEQLVLGNGLDKKRPIDEKIGKAARIDDALGRYVVFLKSTFPKDLNLQGLRIVVDCAHGAAYKVAPSVFRELGAEVITLGDKPDGTNINKECGSLFPENMAKAVVQYRADIGISLDGDADRLILGDESGAIVDGDQILGICALDMKSKKTLLKNTVVATPMSNIGLEKFLKSKGIKLERAQVGDRYVVTEMRKNGYCLGGEQSGHLIFLHHSTTGDGTLASLRVLELMRSHNRSLKDLVSEIKLYPQVLENIPVSRKEPLEDIPDIAAEIKNAQETLGADGRVLVRYSGTEPIARVMLEGQHYAQLQGLARQIATSITRALG